MSDVDDEVSALIATLHKTGQRLEELTAGEVDSVADSEGRMFLLRHAQEQLRHSEAAKQTAILNALPAHIALLDTQGLILSVNEAWRQASCADAIQGPGHGIGVNYLELCDGARGENSAGARQVAEGIRSVLAGRARSFSIEYPCHSPAGRLWFLMTATPLSDERPNGIVVMHLDITQRKRAEEEQRSVRLLLDNIVDNIPTAVQVKSVQDDFHFLIWNKAAEAIYGLPRHDAIGRNVRDLWPEADADRMHAADLELVQTREMQDFPDRVAQTKNRGDIHVHMRKVTLSDAGGKVTHLLVVADDMTAQLADQARLRESESRFRSLTKLSSDWYWEQDEEYRFREFSGGDTATGWGPDQSSALGLRRWELPGAEPATGSWDEHKALVEARMPFRNFEYQHTRLDGTRQYLAASGEPVFDAAGRFTGYRGVATDIAERKLTEERIRRLNRVYAVLSGINTLIVRVRDRDELFKEACRIAVEHGHFKIAWIGVVDREAMKIVPIASAGVEPEFLTPLKDRFSLREDTPMGNIMAVRAVREKKAMVSNEIRGDASVLYPERLVERGIFSMVILPLLVADQAVGVLALYTGETGFFDEGEMKLLTELAGDIGFALDHIGKETRLNYLAYYDALTGLANRALFHERLEQGVTSAKEQHRKVALVLLDIERFKTINDTLGRPAGDALLKELAARLSRYAVDAGRLARIDADHFAVMMTEAQTEEEVARVIEQRVGEIFGAPVRIGDSDLRISARFGIAMFPGDGADADTLFRNAEAALEKAKASGERYLFYTQSMNERVAEKLSMENKLRQALEKDEFVLHYQPKVDLETRSIQGVEALIRWQSPDLGLVPPMRFISLLEETGLILQVGAWALKRAALDHRGWAEAGLRAPKVAVNVSPIQLRQREFVGIVEQAILEGATPTGLDLEITESLIMEDIQGNIEKLKAIRALGVGIAIDDFGTGYSSLAYLATLPVETLKIDRAFIVKMTEDPNAAMLVQTMISLAHSLRLRVVAEGVETEEQANMLRLLRSDQMQGYLFSEAVPNEILKTRFLIPLPAAA